MRFKNLQLSDVRVFEESEPETSRRHLVYDYFAEWISNGGSDTLSRVLALMNKHLKEGKFGHR